jgi:hypothetical protein
MKPALPALSFLHLTGLQSVVKIKKITPGACGVALLRNRIDRFDAGFPVQPPPSPRRIPLPILMKFARHLHNINADLLLDILQGQFGSTRDQMCASWTIKPLLLSYLAVYGNRPDLQNQNNYCVPAP